MLGYKGNSPLVTVGKGADCGSGDGGEEEGCGDGKGECGDRSTL